MLPAVIAFRRRGGVRWLLHGLGSQESENLGREANERLRLLARCTSRELRALDPAKFRRSWQALLFAFPGLHPDNGDDRFVVEARLLEAADWRERHSRRGSPVALELIGREAWNRYEAGELTDAQFYSVVAQRAGLRKGEADRLLVAKQ
jgi:hypothetical protein